MSICLTTTWYPRGELARFTRLLPMLEEKYVSIVVALVQDNDAEVLKEFTSGKFSADKKLIYFVSDYQQSGRHMALKKTVEVDADFVHYADMDRLLRWAETRPDEWRKVVARIEDSDYLVMGRSAAAYATHPQALVRTEAISNHLISWLVGQTLDVSAGSKGFSRRAAQLIVDHADPNRGLGADGAWTVLLHRAGYRIDYLEVDGLDWETADRYQSRSADVEQQQKLAEAYDKDPAHWAMRVEVAMEIVEAGLDAAEHVVPEISDCA